MVSLHGHFGKRFCSALVDDTKTYIQPDPWFKDLATESSKLSLDDWDAERCSTPVRGAQQNHLRTATGSSDKMIQHLVAYCGFYKTAVSIYDKNDLWMGCSCKVDAAFLCSVGKLDKHSSDWGKSLVVNRARSTISHDTAVEHAHMYARQPTTDKLCLTESPCTPQLLISDRCNPHVMPSAGAPCSLI